MKVVILAGGFGTRFSEESKYKPKPMVEIGGMPILWHIMKLFSTQGYNEFIICAGYKQHLIKEWFANYFLYTSDVTFNYKNDNTEITIHNKHTEPWTVTIVDTGLNTMTGGRIKRIKKYVGDEPFILTYGDAVGDIDVNELVCFHRRHGKIGTISVYNFRQNKGVLDVEADGKVNDFREKSDLDGNLINIGYMVMNPEIINRIDSDETVFEEEPLNSLVKDGELMARIHKGFWQCMDTLREKQQLEKLWCSNKCPWKIWED